MRANGRLLASGGIGRPGHLSPGEGSAIDILEVFTGKKFGTLPVTPHCLAFSPDGLHMATGGFERDILIWEAPTIQPPKNAIVPSVAKRDTSWTALGGQAKDAYNAMGQMLDFPEETVKLLKERVQPVESSDGTTVAKLIAKLARLTDEARAAIKRLEG